MGVLFGGYIKKGEGKILNSKLLEREKDKIIDW